MLIEMENIEKRYPAGDKPVAALRGVSFGVEEGEMVAILGPSGSGKSTLMNILGCLDTPTGGKYRLAGQAVSDMSGRRLSAVRSRTVGFVFQNFHLLPGLTALENVELPLIYRGMPAQRRRQAAMEALTRVGLSERTGHYPRALSGGQQQRVAIARAMAGAPPLLLADEPTGNLDSEAGRRVMELLTDWHAAGNTVILITHDPRIGAACPRRITVEDGRILSDER